MPYIPVHPLQVIILAQGRNQRWLAREAGVSEFHLSRVLRGRVPATDDLRMRCARVLCLPVEVLFPPVEVVPSGTMNVPVDRETPDAA